MVTIRAGEPPDKPPRWSPTGWLSRSFALPLPFPFPDHNSHLHAVLNLASSKAWLGRKSRCGDSAMHPTIAHTGAQ